MYKQNVSYFVENTSWKGFIMFSGTPCVTGKLDFKNWKLKYFDRIGICGARKFEFINLNFLKYLESKYYYFFNIKQLENKVFNS